MSVNPDEPQLQSCPFCTPEFEQALIKAVQICVRETEFLSTRPLFRRAVKKNKSVIMRVNLEEALRQAFDDFPNVTVTSISGSFVIIVDGKYFLYLRKSDDVDTYFVDPKSLHRLQVRFYEEAIPMQNPFPNMVNLVGMPITDVLLVPTLYICDDEHRVIGLCINRQENGDVVNSTSIPLTSSVVSYPSFEADDQADTGLIFGFKGDNDPREDSDNG